MTPTAAPPEPDTFADVLRALGDIPLDRILWNPRPGTATEADMLRYLEGERRRVELIDGILVEKPTGKKEGMLALWIGTLLNNFIVPRRLGYAAGPDAPVRMMTNHTRLPDVWYVARASLPDGKDDDEPVAGYAPDLCVEVLSESNTKKEIERKRREYFAKGTKLVWVVDRWAQSVTAYTTRTRPPFSASATP